MSDAFRGLLSSFLPPKKQSIIVDVASNVPSTSKTSHFQFLTRFFPSSSVEPDTSQEVPVILEEKNEKKFNLFSLFLKVLILIPKVQI